MPQLAEITGDISAWSYWLATGIFAIAFIAIITEKIHKTKVALAGATLTMSLAILTQAEAFHSQRFGIDYNVIFLLISMMIIVNIIGKSGVFEWTAIRCAKIGRGRPLYIMMIFIVLTAMASALLDNVTTVLLLAPVTLLIADELDIDPVPFLIAEVLASNIGGTATLIGDPPNIIIGSRAQLSFMDFVVHLGPAVVVMLVAFVLAVWLVAGRRLRVDESKRRRILDMDEQRMIKDPRLALYSVIVLALMLLGFLLHGALHLEPATIALGAATLLLLICNEEPHQILADVEWSTIFFLIGLFIMVGGISKVGLIRDLAALVMLYTEPSADNMQTTAIAVLWSSALLSAVVDNIPYVATMSPMVLDLANSVFHSGAADAANLPIETLHQPVLEPVWWALALGSCLGGNGTIVGASANVVVVGIAEKSGLRVSFLRFLAIGAPTMLLTVVIAHVYILLRYY